MLELLPNLLKAGGIAGLVIGVVYLIYRQILELGVIPRLKQWQGFALLCLLAVLVFATAITVLFPRKPEPSLLDGELPPANHFQADARDGIFCEQRNVDKPFVPFFDAIDITLKACTGSEKSGSRGYRVDWQPSKPREVTFVKRRGYDHCFVSDFAERAPAFVQNLQAAFDQNKDSVPCQIGLAMTRQIRITYLDLRNQSREVAFIQSYNRGGTGRFEIEQVATKNLARSDQMIGLAQDVNSSVSPERLITIAGQYGFPGIPRQ